MNADTPVIKQLLDGTNYQRWRFEIEPLMLSRDLWGIVTGEEIQPEAGKEQQKYLSRMRIASGLLRLSVEPTQYAIIDGKRTPAEMMKAIKDRYEDMKPNSVIHLIWEFTGLKMEEGMGLNAYFDKIDTLHKQIKQVPDLVIPQPVITALTVRGLTPEF